MKRAIAFSIAGSDPGGGAGIQQDLRVFTVLNVYGCAAITALTVQNTLGVQALYPVSGKILEEQIQAVMEDIHPRVIKIGMLATRSNVEAVAKVLSNYTDTFVVADPVILSKNGVALLNEDALETYVNKLFPLIDLLTPNIPETEKLSGISKKHPEFPYIALMKLRSLLEQNRSSNRTPSILLKGGHGSSSTVCRDVLCTNERYHVFESSRLTNPHTHGTGCTLSSAIAAFIARGEAVPEAVERARGLVYEAIRAGFPAGRGTGPVDPMVFLK